MYREQTVMEGNWDSNQWFGAEGRKKETFNQNRMKKEEFKKKLGEA